MGNWTNVYAIYVVPAAILFGVTIIGVLVRKKPQLLSVEYVAWLLPGATYWFLSDVLNLDQAFGGKSLGNLVEPILVAVVSWLLFVVRLRVAVRNPQLERTAALWCIALCHGVAVGVLVLTPQLAE